MREYVDGQPVSVRIQKMREDLETAKHKLIESSLSKDCSYMILVRTNSINSSLFETTDEKLLVIDSLDFNLKNRLQRKTVQTA